MKYDSPLRLRSGNELKYRIVQSPMVTQGADTDGYITDENLAYYGARTKVAGAIIVEAANINDEGRGFDKQIAISDEKYLDGLKKLATTIKKDGALAIIQIYHGGRESITAYNNIGYALAPSAIDYSFISYPVREMTNEEIKETIKAYGRAARLAYEAGFDGVEIHGANHYLIQQFFSTLSNHREDEWGGSLEKRMAFPLAVVDEVKRVVGEFDDSFIIGYRISPEEIHGDAVGYDYTESTKLVSEISKRDLDYIHLSLWTGFDDKPANYDKTYASLFKEVSNDTPIIVVSEVKDENDVEKALEIADIVAIGRASLLNPDFTAKLVEGRADEIVTEMTKDNYKDMHWPEGLFDWYTVPNTGLPPVAGIESVIGEVKYKER